MAKGIPSARTLIEEALRLNPDFDINSLHANVFNLMIQYRSKYYEARVDSFLSGLDLPKEVKLTVKQKMLEPVVVGDKKYSNFMEEVSRRVSQAFQPISGKVAELCAERELNRIGLVKGVNYASGRPPRDIIIYYPTIHQPLSKHAVEIKNVKLRERATRGLLYGDSLFGFFDDEGEFTETQVKEIDRLCLERGGYCYIPPSTLDKITYKGKRMRPNTRFAQDMLSFSRTGKIV